ncbi:MAG: hypothetical protein CVU59_04545 [Deltaproteobacteria bacterium HGW-Deltaproteobacteria-17]|nr:MAG: hypothetical protein CVU59_04545 [Deltaproteobacteria bacterium HGW-Deltaproteobacteria-17]
MTDKTEQNPEEETKNKDVAPATESGETEKPSESVEDSEGEKGSPLQQAVKEIVEPFKGLAHTSRSLWGLYISYVLEGMAYFGILTIFGKYLSENVGLSDIHAGWIYSFFTGGITLSMLFLGGVADKIGIRKALLFSLGLMFFGRLSFAVSGTFFPSGGGFASMMFLFIGLGMLLVVIGYGMYQPASYSGVKQFTNEKNAPMAFAMIYGLMNLGAFFSGVLSPIVRNSWNITSVYWVYAGSSVLAFLCVLMVMTARAVRRDTVTDISAKKPEATEDGKMAEKETQASLFTPIFIGSAAIAVIAMGFTIYLIFTAQPGPVDKPLDEYASNLGKISGLLKEMDPKDPEAKPVTEEDFVKISVEMQKIGDRIVAPEVLPEGARADAVAYELVRFIVKEESSFAGGLWSMMSQLRTPVAMDTEESRAVRTQLRALGVAYMSAAYRLVGKFNADVLTRIALQQKLPAEDSIPVPDAIRASIMEMTDVSQSEMFLKLARLTRDIGMESTRLLGPGSLSIQHVLDLEGRLLEETARKVGGGSASGAVAGLLVQRFYSIGIFLIKEVSPVLVSQPQDKTLALNETVLGMYLGNQIGFAFQMKEAGTSAIDVPFVTSLKLFGMRYGGPLGAVIFFTVLLIVLLLRKRPDHPFHNGKFVFFIFILIPVQTLFAHNWLTLPYYIDRAFGGTPVGQNFELFSNFNPILIFFLTPFVAALTVKVAVYKMMMWGTLVMAVPTFLLALPPSPALLLLYILLMTIGEAMWQPRFLQWVAQIAPEGKTGAYMGIAQFPWFLTKVLTGFYSGYFLSKYCPLVGPQNTEMLWFIYGMMALVTPIALIAASRWMSKGMMKART